jgi:[protein-PII] uridylyltransferase
MTVEPHTSPAALAAATGSELRAAVERHRAELLEKVGAGEDGLALGRANAAFLDECFVARFEAARAAAGDVGHGGVALAAVGSFGRGAVAIRSDADVMLVVDPRVVTQEAAASFAEALLYPLWDATLAVGHQVLSVDDALPLAQADLATATALLDMRPIAGDAALARDLFARAAEGLFGEEELGAFFARLDAEAGARHGRFGGSVYLLEPDVKAGAGGLRDIDGIRWAARARYRVGHVGRWGPGPTDEMRRAGQGQLGTAGDDWADLVRLGVLVAREAHEITSAEEFLWRVRNRLHARAGRKADRLGFEEQEAIAVAMGYGDDRARAAERLMQDYYLHARAVTRARASLILRLQPPRRRARSATTDGAMTSTVDLEGGVRLFDGHVTIAGTAELAQDPALAMRLYAACVRHAAPVLAFARDAVARAAADPAWCERLRASAEAAGLFVDLVCTVPEVKTPSGSVAGELHDVGLLLAMLPEFLPVTGRVHHDVYHVYTVDVHSVAAVDRLRAFARGELAAEFPLASRLAAEIALPRPLFLATLLHDVGKGWPDSDGSRKNHSKTGAELCDRILPRLGLAREDVDEARQLVLDHLLLYHVATRRDLDDPATIEEVCRRPGGGEGLRNLYLLTIADISTTSPTAMTSWKARMLDELYFAAEAHFAGRELPADADRAARARAAVRKASGGAAGAALEALLASMPERYLLANAPESIKQHARVVAERGTRAAHVALVGSRHGGSEGAAELCVVADDRAGLLASIAAALTANRLEVLEAQVYSRQRGDPVGTGPGRKLEAVDLFWVRDREGGTDGVPGAMQRLARDLDDVCSGRVDAAELLRARAGAASPWRERPSPAVPTEVILDDRASPRHTVVEVFAKDRAGLLYDVAGALHELRVSIALSKINTEGTRVADVFYVSELDGSKVAPGPRYKEIHDVLVRAALGK